LLVNIAHHDNCTNLSWLIRNIATSWWFYSNVWTYQGLKFDQCLITFVTLWMVTHLQHG
jgi:hypothetical protein